MGDFNGRTGDTEDSYIDNVQINDLIPTPCFFKDIPKRRNCDEIINSHGSKIIELCKSFDFRILNGRTKGDKIGNFTHLNTNQGFSTIDYSLCTEYLYKFIDNFFVLPMNGLSDHSKICTVFKSCLSISKDEEDNTPVGKKFRWENKNKMSFQKLSQ